MCVRVCRGLQVWVCTGGAGIAAGVCGSVQWLDMDCKTHAKEKLTHQLTCIQLKAWLIYIKFFPKQQHLHIKTTPAQHNNYAENNNYAECAIPDLCSSATTNNYAEINTLQRYIRHVDYVFFPNNKKSKHLNVTKFWTIKTPVLNQENYKTRALNLNMCHRL